MKTFDRKRHWDKVYEGKSPLDVSWFQAEPVRSLGLIQNSGIGKDGFVIDVGGGASVLVDALLAAGYARVAVLDISAGALEAARGRLGERAGEVEWLEADITAFKPPHSYALWHDRAVFHFLTEKADRENYVQALKKAVPRAGMSSLPPLPSAGRKNAAGWILCNMTRPNCGVSWERDLNLPRKCRSFISPPPEGSSNFPISGWSENEPTCVAPDLIWQGGGRSFIERPEPPAPPPHHPQGL